ncbi:MAG: hypothetical protein M3347_01245 [Armatimonadota bacterium]|nr:hypothetical protein [Armatimonadota bacterium]
MMNTNGSPEHSGPVEGRRLLTDEHNIAANGLSANGHEPNALFWRHLLHERDEKIVWLHPPVPSHRQHDGKTQNLLGGLVNLLRQKNPYRAWLLLWTYHTRAAAAQEEMEDIVRETHLALAEPVERAEQTDSGGLVIPHHETPHRVQDQSLIPLETALAEARQSFAQAAAQAGLIYDASAMSDATATTDAPDSSYTVFGMPFLKVRKGDAAEATEGQRPPIAEHRTAAINPHLVERALQDSAPSLEDIAGQYGMEPAADKKRSGWLERLFVALAPMVSGFMLALCLGTLVGLVNLRILRSADVRFMDYVPFIGALLLGSVLVFLMGELVATATHSLAHALEMHDSYTDSKDACPRLRGELVMASLFLGSVLLLGIAEVTAEAIGLRTLHLERIRTLALTGTRETTLSLWLYFVIGLLISGPYLLYKASRAWSESQQRLREAWLVHKQMVWLQERRKDVSVQEAFRLAYRVEQLEARLSRIRKRLDESRSAAVGEALRLHRMVEDIVAEQESLTPSIDGAQSDGRSQRKFLRRGNR